MLKKDVIKHFGGVVATAKAMNITSQAVTRWGRVIPQLRAIQISSITDGELVYDEKRYKNRYRRKVNRKGKSQKRKAS